jgi:hypothetical protein
MTADDAPAYGLWPLVILNSLVFIISAFSFSKPQSPRDWRSFGAFSAFIVALFTRTTDRVHESGRLLTQGWEPRTKEATKK